MQKFTKFTAVLLILGLMLPQLLLPLHQAHALASGSFVKTAEVPLPISSIFSKEFLFDTVVRIIARTLIRALANQVIAWIKGEGGKNVGFVGNLERELRREVDIRGAEFLNNLAGINLCGNIGAFLQVSLRIPSNRLKQQLECTVTEIIQNVDDFYQSFANGGWPVFVDIAANPQNDPYGAYLIALDAKIIAESAKRESIQGTFLANKAFLGFSVKREDCTEIGEDGNPLCITYQEVRTPGQLIAETLNKAVPIGFDWLTVSDEINEAIAAIISALLEKLISASFGGGGGLFDDSYGGPPDQLVTTEDQLIRQIDDATVRIEIVVSRMEDVITGWKNELAQLEEECQRGGESAICDQARIDELRGAIADFERKQARLLEIRRQLLAMREQLLSLRQENISELERLALEATKLFVEMEQIFNSVSEKVSIPPPGSG